MATSPCEPIDPAVTHIINWSVTALAHNSEYYKIGFRQQMTIENNLEPVGYFGNPEQGYVIQFDDGDIQWSANSFAALAMLAVDHVKAKVCAAYPATKRVLPPPPMPLVEDVIDLSTTISIQTSFKLFFEYSGPDGQISTTIDLPYMWAFGQGENVAELNFEEKPYLSTEQSMLQRYGSQEIIDFFFNRNMPWPPLPGDYKLLIYPLRNKITGSARIPWGNTEDVAAFNMPNEFAAFEQYSQFDNTELYVFTHKWTIKNIKLVATSYRFEINTTGNPPGRTLGPGEAPWVSYFELIVSYASVGTYQHPQAAGGDAHFYWGSVLDGQDPLFDSTWYFFVPLPDGEQPVEIDQFALYAERSIKHTEKRPAPLAVDCTAIGGGRPHVPATVLRWPDLAGVEY